MKRCHPHHRCVLRLLDGVWLLTILHQNGGPLLPKQGHALPWKSLVLFGSMVIFCSMNSFKQVAVTLLMHNTEVASVATLRLNGQNRPEKWEQGGNDTSGLPQFYL